VNIRAWRRILPALTTLIFAAAFAVYRIYDRAMSQQSIDPGAYGMAIICGVGVLRVLYDQERRITALEEALGKPNE
jgi:hypothetical protein